MGANSNGRRLPIGAEVQPGGGGVHFRVWAPKRERVELVVEDGGEQRAAAVELKPEGDGHFSALVSDAKAGTLYRFRLDGDDYLYPDPASRYQPEGPHGPSQVVDPSAFRWTDDEWRGRPLKGQVAYELHIGTFTPEGTWRAAARELKELADIGVTVVEMMPIADFPGRFGWGYDGVNMFAPTRLYGEPDDLRHFIDEAHRVGLSVILDVVYNHLGPDGNYLGQFSDDFISHRYENEWGDALNFDGPNSEGVREFFISNAGYWIDEYHFDGLRLDATQQIFDSSDEHVLTAIGRRVRESARGRETIIVSENEDQEARLVLPVEEGGYGLDGLWNDDYHHSAVVALTGRNEAYYTDYLGRPQELISAVKYGYLYQGQFYKWQKRRRGTPTLGLPPEAFVTYIENHDQVANSVRGDRLCEITSPGALRAMTALLLLGPGTPMLFQGQEFASSKPFLFFADHEPDLAEKVREGRAKFLEQFRSAATEEAQTTLAAPHDPETFRRCVLDLSEREKNAEVYRMHRDLMHLRRDDPVFSTKRLRHIDGAVLGPETFVLRFFADDSKDDRLLVVNLGTELHLDIAPEPLLAPPAGRVWDKLWSSESVIYGGNGTPPLETEEDNWRIPGQAAFALHALPAEEVEAKTTKKTDDESASGGAKAKDEKRASEKKTGEAKDEKRASEKRGEED